MSSLLQPNLQSTPVLGATEDEPQAPLIPEATPVQTEVKQEKQVDFWADDEDALTGETAVSYEQEDDEDALVGTPGIAENTEDSYTFNEFVSDANKVAYGGVKGLAGLADFVTVPGWALANVVLPEGQAQPKPFTSLLEMHYPEKAYAFEDDPNSYADDVLRVTQTAAEFISPAGPTNLAAKAASKGAYATTQLAEHSMALASGVAYQGTLEAGGSEVAAVAASFIAPASPDVAKASWELTKKTTQGTLKMTQQLPLVGITVKEIKDSSAFAIAQLKADLTENPSKWEGSWYGRMAKAQILKAGDTPRSIELQKKDLLEAQERIHKVIPTDNPGVADHVKRMQDMQDLMNKGRPEDSQIQLTLDQVYRPVLDQMNDTAGFDQLLDTILLTNAEAYTKQLRKNHKVFQEIIKGDTSHLEAKDAEAFTQLFAHHLDELNMEHEKVVSRALGMDPTASERVPGATVYDQTYMAQEKLTKATEDIYEIVDSAYDSMLDKLPKDLQMDTTPLKNSIIDMYNEMGALSNPQDVPTYVRSLMRKMVALGGGEDTVAQHKLLLNKESGLKGQQRELIQQRKLAVQEHKNKLEAMDPELPKEEAKALQKQYQSEFEEAAGLIEQKRRPIDDELAKLEVQKREYRVNELSEDFESIPEPTFTDLGSVKEAINIVNREARKAFKQKEWEKYDNLSFLKKGLDETMESLSDADPDAYKLYNTVNSRYGDFVSRDFNESMARRITEKKGGRERAITSDGAVKKIWVEADAETVQRFMRNFDPERQGIDEYLDTSTVMKDGKEMLGADALLETSQDGVNAMRDIIFTDMSQGLRAIEMRTYMDPTQKMNDIEEHIRNYLLKNKGKLEQVPGFEDHPEGLKNIVKELGAYKQQVKALDEKRNLSLLKNITGPGRTIMDVSRSETKADELVQLMDEMSKNQAVSVDQMRKTMFNALVQKHTTGDRMDANALIRLLDSSADSRHNLSKVLGEEQVGKLLGMAHISKSLETGDTKFTDALTNEKFLNIMEQHGVSMGRIGSLLSRRAVFAPSTGYIAGAFATKVINSVGQKQTSRMLKVLFDNPFELTEMDNFVIKELGKLNEREQRVVQAALDRGDLTSTVGTLKKVLGSALHSHLVSIGLQVTESELQDLAVEFLTEPKVEEKEK